MGNGSGFTDIDEYINAADEVLGSMCYHNQLEVLAYMALRNPGLFQEALANATIGCDDVT